MDAARLPMIRFDTANLAKTDQFEAWRGAVGVTHEITSADPVGRDGMIASSDVWRLGQTVVSFRRFPALRFSRRTGRASADGLDHYGLLLMREGTWGGDVDGREVVVRTGEVCLFDLARPVDNWVSANASLRVLVPRGPLDAALPGRALHGTLVGGGAGALLADYLRSLHERLGELTVAEAPHVEHATRGMIMACVAPSAEHTALAASTLTATMLQRARKYIDANLMRPDCSPAGISRALGMSRSALYRLFEPVGGVAGYIQSRRLARIHAVLLDPLDRRRISDLAYAHGFTSEAHFSHAFRRAFGMSASDVRASAVPRSRQRQDGAPGDVYQSWVRGSQSV